ncbi:hypothetical protein JCM11251_000485 [Rhodosporidiobolus azoricus]
MRPFRGFVALAALVSALPLARAERRFYASAVSYCTAPNVEPAIDVDRFLLEYYPDSGTAGFISFDISAASVEANLNPILNFELIAYGINAVNTSINLCDLLGGVLCPLPQYDFVGSATIPLPSIVAGKVNIPGIGYVIPDLEATAYVRLLRTEDNSEAACLRVDLSNGKTTRWASVSWGLGGLAMGTALLSALWFLVGTLVWPSVTLAPSPLANSASSLSPALWASLGRRKERLFLLMSLLQFVATTGLLSLQYPIIYQAFTGNFDWSMGLIRINPVQTTIDQLRNGTGGNLTQLAGRSNLVGGTRALKSIFARNVIPQALPGAEEVATAILTELGKSLSPPSSSSSLSSRALSAVSYLPSTLSRRQSTTMDAPATSPEQAVAIPDVQRTSTVNAVDRGIPVTLVNLDISPYNAFTTVFINFLLLCAIAVGLIIVCGAVWAGLRWLTGRKEKKRLRRLGLSTTAMREEDEKRAGIAGRWTAFSRRRSSPVLTVARAGTLRLLIICWYPLLVFTFYQWTLGSSDSYAPIILSVFTIVCVAAALLFLAVRFLLIGRRAFRNSGTAFDEVDPVPLDAGDQLSSPFRPTPSHTPITPNPNPNKALLKAERRQVEDYTTGQMLAAGGAPYSPFWNAYKTRSRRTTTKRRNWWKGRGWWHGMVELLLMPFILACFVSFAKASGWTQSVALVVVEGLLFISLCVWTPYEDKSSNFTHIFWQAWRVIIAGALITFNESIDLNEIARVAIGAVLAVIESVLVVLFFILLVVDFIQLCIFLVRGVKARRRHRQAVDNPVVAPPPMMQTRDTSPTGLGLGPNGHEYEAAPRSSFHEAGLTDGRSSLTLNNSGPPPVNKPV